MEGSDWRGPPQPRASCFDGKNLEGPVQLLGSVVQIHQAVSRRVSQCLSDNGEDVIGHVRRNRVVHRTHETQLGTHPQSRHQLVGQIDDSLAQTARQRSVAELEYGGPDLGDRGVEFIDCVLDAVMHLRKIVEPDRAGKAQADRVDPLDHPVVKISSDRRGR
jgi:hypothetical protein